MKQFSPIRSLAVLVASCLFLAAVFVIRAPVVVVSDAAFESVYGETRAAVARGFLSFRQFRRVSLALVSENAAVESSADAAASSISGGRAAAVLFPYRYASGAELFSVRFPNIPVVVVGGISPKAGLVSVEADRSLDFYRAGRIAGIVVPAGSAPVLYADDDQRDAVRSAFVSGFSDSRSGDESVSIEYLLPARADASPSRFTVDATGIPEKSDVGYIAFSWLDPEMLPRGVVAVFDDSLYAFAPGACQAARRGTSMRVASRVIVAYNGKRSLGEYFRVQGAARARRH